MNGDSLDFLPIWIVFPVTLVIGLLAVEIGCRVARRRKERAKEKTEAPAAPIVAATLGLLAFMLAFTFGIAAARFEERRQALLSESNAIGTTYLRASVLPEPMAADARNLLREYVDVRLAGADPSKLNEAISRSEELHKHLWSQAVGAAQKERSPMTSLFMQSLNDVINLHEKRVMAALHSRVPGVIWLGLYLLLVLSMAVLGYHEGISGSRRSLAGFALVLAFSTVLVVITDLDRPGEGLLRVSQQSLVNVRKTMAATTP
ncbi:MAG TPA: hypothetical protein VIT19_03735 [Pyrinomonadaceae bacterium]